MGKKTLKNEKQNISHLSFSAVLRKLFNLKSHKFEVQMKTYFTLIFFSWAIQNKRKLKIQIDDVN